MSTDVVVCPQCATNLQNSAEIAGQIVACPQCQTQLQMPSLTPAASHLQSPVPATLPPGIELPPSALPAAGNSGMANRDSGAAATRPMVQSTLPRGGSATSVSARMRKRSNPLLIVFVVVMVLILIGVGTVGVRWDREQKAKQDFGRQMIGNWELVPGQSQLDRWDFAFHVDGQLQMALGNELNEGSWKVTSVQGTTGFVSIRWPDDGAETMRVRFDGGAMHVELDSVGNFSFRAAVP